MTKLNKIVKSPLRYPGSKSKFCVTLHKIMKANNISPDLFIEPFAGGMSVSLFMLQNNYTNKIALIEKDPLVASFWHTVFYESDWLINEIQKMPITLEQWHYFKNYEPKTKRAQGLKCLFLNRTNFSGILKAGPIGGKKQISQYKIDSRFNKDNIINRIQTLSLYRDRVLFIDGCDYLNSMNKRKEYINKSSFLYFDPPYVNKAKYIYNYYFNYQDHLNLKRLIQNLNSDWLLSYDYEPVLNGLYKTFANYRFFDMCYMASTRERVVKKEFIASNLTLS